MNKSQKRTSRTSAKRTSPTRRNATHPEQSSNKPKKTSRVTKSTIEPVWVPESLLGCKLSTHEGERITIPNSFSDPESKHDWLLDVNTMLKEIRLIKSVHPAAAGIKKYTMLVHVFKYLSYFTQGELLKCDRGMYTVIQEKQNEWYVVSHGMVKKFIHNEQITGVKLDHGIPIATSKNWIIILSPTICKVKQDLYSCYMNKDLVCIETLCDVKL